jgi:hypothetical protein
MGQVTRVTFLLAAAVEQFFSSLPCARQVRVHPGFCIVGSRISWACREGEEEEEEKYELEQEENEDEE